MAFSKGNVEWRKLNQLFQFLGLLRQDEFHIEHVRKEYLHGREAFLLYPMVLPSSPEKFWAEKIRKKSARHL